MTREELRAVIAAAIKDATSIGGALNKPCVIGHFSAADAALAAIEAAGVRLVPVEASRHMLVAAHMVERDDCDFDYHRANKSAQYDGYGIFLTYTCPKCHREKMQGFRADIRERYETDDRIEDDL